MGKLIQIIPDSGRWYDPDHVARVESDWVLVGEKFVRVTFKDGTSITTHNHLLDVIVARINNARGE